MSNIQIREVQQRSEKGEKSMKFSRKFPGTGEYKFPYWKGPFSIQLDGQKDPLHRKHTSSEHRDVAGFNRLMWFQETMD